MASTLLMVEPNDFGYNEQTSSSNSFQNKTEMSNVKEMAMKEFNNAVESLQKSGISILTFSSPENLKCPDAVFPNNWFSTHQDGSLILYPMLTPNRRAERNQKIIDYLKGNYRITDILNFTEFENENKILEGTGSIVFDHSEKWAYACISPRTNEQLLNKVCEKIKYSPIVFEALDLNGKPIYHTNVVMAIGQKYVVICLDCIENTIEKSMVKQKILESGKELIEISIQQMNSFAGNMLEVYNKDGNSILVLSKTAFDSLQSSQKETLSIYSKLLPLDIHTIENIGGGSARCMMAEIHFTPKIP